MVTLLKLALDLFEARAGGLSGFRPYGRIAGCCCRTAEQRDELAPFKVEHGDLLPDALSKPPTGRCAQFAPMPRTRAPMRAYARLAKSLTWLPAASACRHLH
jgi:hypothetical protein